MGERLTSKATPVSTRMPWMRMPQARPRALSKPARRPWCTAVRTTSATSGPGLTRAMANTAANDSKTEVSCMEVLQDRGDSALWAAQRLRSFAGGRP
ncbi:hypothetical protein D9M71_687070 [compost metagenome]